MISNAISELILNRLKENDLVIDIGGGRYPWFRADYILDKRKFDERVGEIAFGGRENKRIYYSKKTWISHDFYDLPWPFKDNFFDFSLCMGTLEDIRDPISICKEITRISKAGYISTPTRAAESKKGISKHRYSKKLIGYYHHRWFVEIINSKLVFKMKNSLLYQNTDWLIDDVEQYTLNYFWDKNFKFEEQYVKGHDLDIKELKKFYHDHYKWSKLIKKDRYSNYTRYNNWPKNWGPIPQFIDMDNNTVGRDRKTSIKNKVKSLFRIK